MNAAWRWLIRQGLRRGFQRGVVDGNQAWIVIGGAALLAYLFGRYGGRETEVILLEQPPPGETLRITQQEAGENGLA